MACAAALLVLAFPPHAVLPAGLLVLAPLAAALERCRGPGTAFLLGLGFGVPGLLAVCPWVVHMLSVEADVPRPAAWVAAVGLAVVTASFGAAAASAYRALRPRLSAAAAPLAFGAVWALVELVRAEPARLPWVLLPHALARHPLLLQTAELGGALVPGFVLASLQAGFGMALVHRRLTPLAAPLALGALALGHGVLGLLAAVPAGEAYRVGIVQAAIPQHERFREGSARRNTRRHEALTRELVRRERPDLVVWSETAIDTDLDRAPELAAEIGRLVDELGVPLLTGAPRSRDGSPTNSVVLFLPGRGIAATYDKQILVPFAEFDPPLRRLWRPLLGGVTKGDPYVPGAGPVVFRNGVPPLATPICFEITYPFLVRAMREAGAELVVNLTNDAWFGRDPALEMHFAHAVFRAIETRTFVVRAANTGISGVIDPRGVARGQLGIFEEGTLVADVHRSSPRTLYARFGSGPAAGALAALLVLLAVGPGRFRRRRGAHRG